MEEQRELIYSFLHGTNPQIQFQGCVLYNQRIMFHGLTGIWTLNNQKKELLNASYYCYCYFSFHFSKYRKREFVYCAGAIGMILGGLFILSERAVNRN